MKSGPKACPFTHRKLTAVHVVAAHGGLVVAGDRYSMDLAAELEVTGHFPLF